MRCSGMSSGTHRLRGGFQRLRGFTLIEALVALVVMSFGMLALASMHGMLSRSADAAKQRSEAVRLAQERMECLRSFSQIATGTGTTTNCLGVANKPLAWDDLASGTDATISSTYSNTDYTRAWTFSGTSADSQRALSVRVAWTDRAGDAQEVRLSSVIAKADPSDPGALAFPLPQNVNIKRPKNRNLNIPVPAVDLGGGQSAYQLSSNLAVIFNNITGYVVRRCSGTITAANYASATCETLNAFIVAGYITGASSNAVSVPTGISMAGVSGATGAISCAYGDALDQNSGNTVIANTKYYLCVIPVGSGVNAKWSGTVRLSGMTTRTGGLAPSNSQWLVCRFQYPSDQGISNNQRNLQPYVDVTDSLDNQNYYVASASSGTCPSITSSVGSGQSVLSSTLATSAHQDCRSGAAGNTPTNCPTAATGT